MSVNSAAVQVFINSVRSGEWADMRRYYAPDVVFDGTVPRWHFAFQGVDRVVDEMMRWFPHQAVVTDLVIIQTDEGASIEFERRWQRPLDDGGSEGVGIRQMHLLRLDDSGRIVEQHGHCAGIWDDATFATIEAEAPKV